MPCHPMSSPASGGTRSTSRCTLRRANRTADPRRTHWPEHAALRHLIARGPESPSRSCHELEPAQVFREELRMRVIEARELTKVYGRGENRVEALSGMNMNVEPCEWIAIVGPSGSGKSTLMHLIGLLDRPTSGNYVLDGRDVSGLQGGELANARRDLIGFVFQSYNLLPRESAQERGASDGLRWRGQEGAQEAGSRGSGEGRALREGSPPSARALRRADAAGSYCQGAGQRPCPAAG